MSPHTEQTREETKTTKWISLFFSSLLPALTFLSHSPSALLLAAITYTGTATSDLCGSLCRRMSLSTSRMSRVVELASPAPAGYDSISSTSTHLPQSDA